MDGNLSDEEVDWGTRIDNWVEKDPTEYDAYENLSAGEEIDIWIGN